MSDDLYDHDRACTHDEATPATDGTGSVSRRALLRGLAALGLSGPAALAALRSGDAGADHALLDRGELEAGFARLRDEAPLAGLAGYATFEILPADLPWKRLDVAVKASQAVTVLLSGRWWLVEDLDVWVEPGLAFFARVGDRNPVYNPQKNTGTFTSAHDGHVSVARAIGEWADSRAETVATPPEVYSAAKGEIRGVLLVWDGDPLTGLEALRRRGDVGGLVTAEIARLRTEPPPPAGWQPMYVTGNAGIYSSCADGQICCHTHKNACLLTREVDLPLAPGARLDWRWAVEELPSARAEDSLLAHDYLSIAVEFDDGQDLTYFWSAELPVGRVFRCPIPSWQAIETHMVVRSGRGELGRWLAESRDVHADYQTHIGGPATRIVKVWLIALSFFQRGTGKARYADIVVSSGGETKRLT
ncbi:MAG: DUF3047 domain-containing protein [Gammaproteobacteria bacterium]